MILKEQVFDRAVQMAGVLDEGKRDVLWVLCGSSAAALAARLRTGIAPEDCLEEFVTAASLYALGALGSMDGEPAEFKAGDLTVKHRDPKETEAAVRQMERQADAMMRPYLKDIFLFAEV